MTDRKNAGFTLVELMVTILVASIVTVAATSLLLMGLRISKQSNRLQSIQNTTRILMTALEDMASEGAIAEVAAEADSWQIKDGNGNTLMHYSGPDQTIYSGKVGSGNVLVEEILSSYMILDGRLLTFTVETEEGEYRSSVYCRTIELPENIGAMNENLTAEDLQSMLVQAAEKTNEARKAFLDALVNQYKTSLNIPNIGKIIENDALTETYYSEWYITSKGGQWQKNGWDEDTPWCACYISWVLAQEEVSKYLRDVPCFANVDYFMAYLEDNHCFYDKEAQLQPNPGDLIFFDWKVNFETNPEHVGVVIFADENKIYTIEGNGADNGQGKGIVAIKEYDPDDAFIIGYGFLPWLEEAKS